jgi:hypothetical protein
MAHAMLPVLESAFAQHALDRQLRESADGYEITYQRTESALVATARRGTDTAEGVIEWVLGAGAQGQTPLVRAANGMLESRVSYFPQLRQYGITIGQAAGGSPKAIAALGVRQNNGDLQSCIGCHASAITRDLQPVIPGVQCQRCHLGSGEHARSGAGKIGNPGKLTASEEVRFCGNCHRVKSPVSDAALENLRFQPLRLMKSRCFTSGQLSCTTCHAAHEDAKRNDPDFYNDKCHACHAGKSGGKSAHADARQSGDCIGCHMPYVQLHPALRFTDHYIRVVKAGDLPQGIIRQRGSIVLQREPLEHAPDFRAPRHGSG